MENEVSEVASRIMGIFITFNCHFTPLKLHSYFIAQTECKWEGSVEMGILPA